MMELILNPRLPDNHRRYPDYMAMHRSVVGQRQHPTARFNRQDLRRSLIGRTTPLTPGEIGLLYHHRALDINYRVRMPNQPNHYGDMTETVRDMKSLKGKKTAAPKEAATPPAKSKAPAGAGRGGIGNERSFFASSFQSPARPVWSGQTYKRPDLEYG